MSNTNRQSGSKDGANKLAGKRPDFQKPAYWSNEPLPEPSAPAAEQGEGQGGNPKPSEPGAAEGTPSPTRYGDWVVKGIAVDF